MFQRRTHRVRGVPGARATRTGRALAVAASLLVVAPGHAVEAASTESGQTDLEAQLLNAVRDARFGETIDFGPFEDVCPGARFCPVPAQPVKHMPNIDVAVIELDAEGNAVRAANVLVSRDYPSGVVAPIDLAGGAAGSWGVSGVRWRRWDIDRYNGGTFDQHNGKQRTVKGWTDNPPLTQADDIVPGRESESIQFMAPYPASLFKVIVAFRIMRLVDMGQLSLDQLHRWDPTVGQAAQGKERDLPYHAGRAPAHDTRTRSIRDWMASMITVSDNDSTRALLKLLWDRNDLPAMHAELRELGLGTLQINGTDPASGRLWFPGQIHMTSMDTARLLWLIHGGAGSLWTRPDGQPVPASLLSDGSRSFLTGLLDQQGFHEALSTTNLCGAPNTNPGIPARIDDRWINPDGTVTVDGFPYGRDVRPCNDAAEVVFGHKTGLTFNYGANAGIVRALPGQGERRYVISFIASLGYRYTDAVFASRSTYPCYDAVGPICYTQRIPAMAKQIDDYLKVAG
jgi:hypothetical protein